MLVLKALALFVVTAIAEILGCYLPYVWLRKDGSVWLLIPAAISLALFAWLLTLHPAAAGRVYAAYGGVYIAVALLWLEWELLFGAAGEPRCCRCAGSIDPFPSTNRWLSSDRSSRQSM
jgi:small multidrug resistance family-3 protein